MGRMLFGGFMRKPRVQKESENKSATR
jgi:hypothetical protein